MTKWQMTSAFIIIFTPGLIILYDVIANFAGGKEATITWAVQQAAAKYQELPWATAGMFVWLWLHLFAKVVLDRHVG